MRPIFGDIVETNDGQGYIIGLLIDGFFSEDRYVAAIDGGFRFLSERDCRVISAGFYDICFRRQKQYLNKFPKTLKGLY